MDCSLLNIAFDRICNGQLPVYQGWYIARPSSSRAVHQSLPTWKLNKEQVKSLSTGQPFMLSPFPSYPYEINHVQRIIRGSEDVRFQNRSPFENMENFGSSIHGNKVYGAVPSESAKGVRRASRPENYHLSGNTANHPRLPMSYALSIYDKPRPEETEETVKEVEPNLLPLPEPAHYQNPQNYWPQHGARPEESGEEVVNDEEKGKSTETTEEPCNVEQINVMKDIPETKPVPEGEETEAVVSATATSQGQQNFHNRMLGRHESEHKITPCDVCFEKNVPALTEIMEQHLSDRKIKGSRSEGSDYPETARLLVPIIKYVKNIIGTFTTEKSTKPNDSQPTTTEKPEVQKQSTTMKTTNGTPALQSTSPPPPPTSSTPTPPPLSSPMLTPSSPPPPPSSPTQPPTTMTSATQNPEEAQTLDTLQTEPGTTTEAPEMG